MSLPGWSIRRPVTTVMAYVALVFLGLVALSRIPVDLLPEIAFPVLAVSTPYSGAAPEEVEALITRPVEEVLGLVANMRRISSESAEGSSVVVAEFAWGTNMDAAVSDVRDALELLRDRLPRDAGRPSVLKADPSLLPLMQVVMSGDLPPLALTAHAERLGARLERVEGVAAVRLGGAVGEEVLVAVDPHALAARGLSLAHVVQALRAGAAVLPVGTLNAGGTDQVVRVAGSFESLEELAATTMGTPSGPVAIDEVATVGRREVAATTITRVNGRPGVSLVIQRQSGVNTVLVARRLCRQLQEAAGEWPAGLQAEVVMDQSEFITAAVANVARNAVTGALLAAVVLYAFLRDVGMVLVVATAIPVSVMATFALMYFGGLTLNLMSLGGLALGTGMLVDNAIVVLESIFRHRGRGLDPQAAARAGAEEVTGAVAASTVTTLVVFVPVLFISGLASQLFRDLAITVSIALLVSLAVSTTLVPSAAAWVLGRSRHVYAVQAGHPGYLRVLRALTSRPWIPVVTVALGLLGGAFLAGTVEREFLPAVDRREILVSVTHAPGTRLEDSDAALRVLEEVLISRPGTGLVVATTGGPAHGLDAFGLGARPEHGSVFVRLAAGPGQPSTQAYLSGLEYELGLAQAEVTIEGVSGLSGSERAFGAPVSVVLLGPDLNRLEELAQVVKRELALVSGLERITTNAEMALPELCLRAFAPAAAAHWLTPAAIASALRLSLHGEVAARLTLGHRSLDVRVASQAAAMRVAEFRSQPVPSPVGHSVALGDIATLEAGMGPTAIHRREQSRALTVEGSLAGRRLGGVADDVRRVLERVELPPEYEMRLGGEYRELTEAFSSLTWALGMAVALIYLTLASHFESLLKPLLIMVSVPLALVGAVLGLLLAGHALSVPSLIGMVALAGVVVNNGIVMVDYINHERRSGAGPLGAALSAAVVRLRPILMTTTTTVLGLAPLALGLGRGAELQAPLAVAMAGGLVLSTALTLLLLPALYLLIDRPGR